MTNSMTDYYYEISKYPLLSAEEEKELARRMHNGDEKAREKFINSNLRLVANIVKHYHPNDTDRNDYISAGNLGLISAVNQYDETRGIRFSTYAYNWIDAAVHKYIQDTNSIITIPTGVQNDCYKIYQVKNYLRQILCNDPTIEDIENCLAGAYSVETIKTCLEIMNRQCISLDHTISNDEDSKVSLGDLIVDTTIESPEEHVNRLDTHETIINILQPKLTQQEFDILVAKYDLNQLGHESTLEEISQQYGCSRENIRLIIKKAIEKLQNDKEVIDTLSSLQGGY